MASLGDVLYRGSSVWKRLVGNTTTTRKFLTQTGSGSASAAPAWNALALTDLPATLGQVLTETVTLTDAQVKALPTTPITLVAAPGSGLYVSLLRLELKGKFGSGAYTNLNASYCAIGAGVGTSGAAGGAAPTLLLANDSSTTPALTLLSTFLGATSRRVVLLPYMESVPAYVVPGGASAVYAEDLFTDLDNQPLQISIDNNGSGNLTGGNAANSLKATVLYTLEAVP